MKTLTLLAMTVLVALNGASATYAQFGQIRQELVSYLETQNIDGASFYADIDGKISAISVGTIDAELETDTKNDTRFYIASSGKMMVAAAALSMVDEGKLQLDERVWPLIKSIDGIDRLKNADKVTLRQILNHTSGLAEYLNDDFGNASAQSPNTRWTPAEAVSFAYGAQAVFAPGTSFEYTNTNYVLLGHLLAQVDGSMATALHNRVFDKANMDQSSIGADVDEVGLAHGFDEDGNDASEQAWASTLGDGPVVSSAKDVAKFMQALFHEKTLLSQEMLGQMIVGSAHDEGYGLGMGIDGDDFGEWYGHAGSYGGYEADVRYYPELNATLVVLMNGNPTDQKTFLETAADYLFN